jgi:aconitate hydratase
MGLQNNQSFNALRTFATKHGTFQYYGLGCLETEGIGAISRLPFTIKILLESILRNLDGRQITEKDIKTVADWPGEKDTKVEIPFKPARLLLQDFTGVPALVDLAAMRSAMESLGGDPQLINPQIPAELVVDHSVQVDRYGDPRALEINMELEFKRNLERYQFLKWGQNAFHNFRVFPPGVGIVHQVNLEYLARVVFQSKRRDGTLVYPDSLVGTDSHTPMINGLGIVGWGVGGIEAEAVMLGQPIFMLMPDVIGLKINGALQAGTTATDLVLTVTEMLRRHGVVNKFIEFFGPGMKTMSLPDRATISNMSPEFGATLSFWPVDEESLKYLAGTGRDPRDIDIIERYLKQQGLFYSDDTIQPEFTKVLELDLNTVEPSVAGPKRPQDRMTLSRVQSGFRSSLTAKTAQQGFDLPASEQEKSVPLRVKNSKTTLRHGSVVIAAITSCTNTSNPKVMLAAGLLAKRAVEKGLKISPLIKTSLAPGSRVVTDYYRETGLDNYLETLGFHTVGYGCTTCIGNSGPLEKPVADAIEDENIVAVAVLSGNRNFEGRINPYTKAGFLTSPPLVVAYALAGTVDIDLTRDPIGLGRQNEPVYLKDIWPTNDEIDQLLEKSNKAEYYTETYQNIERFSPPWQNITTFSDTLYPWNAESTYIQEPPFFKNISPHPEAIEPVLNARVLVMLGDSVTTDHISPAGVVAEESPAGRYLKNHGVNPMDFNSYGSRRGNDQVMTRGTFANIRIKNLLTAGTEGGVTVHFPDREKMWIYDAAEQYRETGTPLIVLAGKEYGTGSSRDWAAKGTLLLGVKVVIAESYERIHRSNLVGMGVLPLQFRNGDSIASLGLTGDEKYDILLSEDLKPGQEINIKVHESGRKKTTFTVKSRLDSDIEVTYFKNGGILPTVLRTCLQK